jgi:multidrug transporter EmrE-like cation transporter
MPYIFLVGSIICNLFAYMLFKHISGKPFNPLWVSLFSAGLILGAVNSFLFTKSLKDLNLGIAYPIFSAGSIIVIMIVSAYLFGENFKPINAAGALVAIAGIILLTR